MGHLQRNKVKYIAPFVQLIHAVDSLKLLKEINKEAGKNDRVIDVLFQVHISRDESKFGLDYAELRELMDSKDFGNYPNVRICGLMGIATLTDDQEQIRKEFRELKHFFDEIKQQHFPEESHFSELSMGMTSDYKVAIAEGSTIIRVGSYIFGERDYGNGQ